MEKPLNLPLLLKTITELIAEESETHLQRLAGHRRDTLYLPPGLPTDSTTTSLSPTEILHQPKIRS
jgi:hypothetical protein